MNRIQTIVAAILTGLVMIGVVTLIYLAFFFPKIQVAWMEQGRSLSSAELFTVQLSMFCTHFGLVLLPLLVVGVVGCAIWTAYSRREFRKECQPFSAAKGGETRRR